MADLATLGIAVDSRPVSSATSELDKLSAAAKKAEGATNEIGRASEGASRSHSRVAAEVAKAERAQRDYDRAVRLANGGLTEHQRRALEAARANDNFSNAADRAARSAGGFEQAVGMARRALGALGLALGVREIINYADAWSDMQSRVGAAIRNMDAAPQMMARLVQIANESYSSLGQTVEVYSRNVTVLRDLGRGADDAATFTSALNNALVLTATRGERAASVQDALSKAMAVGKLQADGLETVLANGGAVAEALADELGTTVNGLREMASAGLITGNVLANSLIKRADEFSERVQEMPSTVQDAFLRLQNNFTAFIGTMDNGTGASATLSDAIMLVANNLETVARLVGVAATAAGTFYVQSLVRATAAKIGFGVATSGATGFLGLFTTGAVAARRGVDALTAAMARNPFGLVAVGIAAAVSSLTLFRDEIRPVEGEVASLGDYMRALGETSASAWSSMSGHVGDWATAAVGYLAMYVSAQDREARILPESWGDAWEEIQSVFGRGIANVVDTLLVIPSAGAAARIALVDAWGALPSGLGAATIEAARIVLLTIEEMVDGAISLVNQAIQGANERFGLGLSKIPGIVGTISGYLSPVPEDAKAAGEEAGRGLASRFSEAFDEEHARRRGTVDGIMSSITDGLQSVRDRANEIGAARTEVDVLNDALAGTGPAAGAAAAGIDGATQSTKELEKAAREAEAAQRALFAEADRAVASFFPMEKATAEAERLGAIVRDTTNGLTGLQRSALTMQIDENFRRAAEQANRASGSVGAFRDTAVGSAQSIGDAFIQNVGDVFSDIFSQATRDGDRFFDSILRGFAGLGSQLAAAGAKNLFGSLFGMPPSGQTQSAAGIGSFPLAANDNSVATMRTVGALNENLRQSSRSALDVARAFNGLTEKADAPVLDSFMQASGTWGNLSAKDTAWCAAFANAAIVQAGGRGTGSNLASSFMGWGQGTNAPQIGDIVVLKPQSAGASGHVGFVAGFGDGKVQVFGGNQSNAANVRSFGLDQVRGYRTGAGTGGLVTGTATEADPWNGLRSVTPGANGPLARGFLYQNQQGQTVNHLGMTRGQQIMGGVGAGLGIFSQGVQSGSVGMGALSGGLGGFQAAGALGVAGPVGLIAGAALGALGGLFGGRQRRKQEHQARAQEWAQLAPQWAEYQDRIATGTGPRSGLRAAYEEDNRQLAEFVRVGSAAWRMGSNNGSDLFDQVSQSRVGYQDRTNQAFRERYWSSIGGLESGRGLEGPFVQAQDSVIELGQTLATFIDDAKVAFGDGSVEAQRAAEASIVQLRASIQGAEGLSEVATRIQEMEGAAAGLRTALVTLGTSAEDAGAAVGQELAAAMNRLRGEFSQGVQDQLWSLDGKGYITEFRQFFTDIDDAIQDALLVGADRGLVDELFVRQAQSMVDGAQLSGEAFNELVSVSPRLAGVVREFSEAAEEAAKRTADQIAALKLSYDDRFFETTIDTSTEAGALARFDRYAAREREEEIKAGGQAILELERALAAERGQIVKQFADRAIEEQKRALESARTFLDSFTRDIGSYLDGLRAGPDSPLTGQARVNEAQAQFDKQYALAMTGDRDALSSITGYADRLIEADRAYNTSSPAAQATFDRVTTALENLPKLLKPEDLLEKAIRETALDTQEALELMRAGLSDAFALGPAATAGALAPYFSLLDTSLDGLLDFNEMKVALNGIATDAQIRQMMNVLDANGDGQISQMELLNASSRTQTAALDRANRQLALLENISAAISIVGTHTNWIQTNTAPLSKVLSDSLSMQERIRANLAAANGVTGARQYMTGGYTGGSSTTEVRGVVHGMEGVLTAPAMRGIGVPALDFMNRERRLPTIAMPVAVPAGNDNGGSALLTEVKALREEVRQLREENNAVTVQAAERVARPVEKMTGATEKGVRETRRARRTSNG